ncbi:tape measure protein [uncultured Fusobacterium sp.]|uniref:tape measure protein n=1 Tax=uncultured Fusobacterium sp. TaxID=159267 RepID=UPI0025D9E2E7|nr:tape measure protein [uncultured Fusobacterium sp.]
MAEINASINLLNGMTQPLMSVIGTVNTMISTLNKVNNTNINIDTSVLKASQSILNNASADLLRYQEQIENKINSNTVAQENFNNSLRSASTASDNLFKKIKRVAAAYLGIQTVKAGINLSDTMTQNTARLNLMNDGNQSTEELQKMIYQSAQSSRGNFLDVSQVVSKLGILAPNAFKSNQEAILFSELMAKSFKIGGASQQEQSAGMYQLTQALASGRLQGDEFRSIMENAPILAQAISKSLGVSIGTLREMSSEGKITSDVIKNAMFSASQEINSQFESIPMTFTDVITRVKNAAIQGFQPIAKQINGIVNSDRVKQFVNMSVVLIGKLTSVLSSSIELIAGMGAAIYDNWSLIAPVLGTVVAGITAYNIALGVIAVKTAIVKGATLAYNLALIAQNTLHGVNNTALITSTAAQWGLNAAMLACPITWIVAGIMLTVGALYLGVAAFNKFTGATISATGIITGAIYGIGAHIYNMIATSVNMFISFTEFLANIFTHPVVAIKRLFINMGLSIINIIKSTMSIVDKIIDTGISDKLSDIESNLKVKLEATTVEGYRDFKTATDGRLDYMKLKDTGEAVTKGYKTGENLSNSLSLTSNLGLNSGMMDQTNSYLSQISGNTAKTNTSLDLTKEELKYMRDLAEQEVINRYTTASMKVEVSNNNNISNSLDIDEVAGMLTNKLVESAATVAEGNY